MRRDSISLHNPASGILRSIIKHDRLPVLQFEIPPILHHGPIPWLLNCCILSPDLRSVINEYTFFPTSGPSALNALDNLSRLNVIIARGRRPNAGYSGFSMFHVVVEVNGLPSRIIDDVDTGTSLDPA